MYNKCTFNGKKNTHPNDRTSQPRTLVPFEVAIPDALKYEGRGGEGRGGEGRGYEGVNIRGNEIPIILFKKFKDLVRVSVNLLLVRVPSTC